MLRLAMYAFIAIAGLSYAEQQGLIPAGKYLAQAPRLSANVLTDLTSTVSSLATSAAHAATPESAKSFTARIAARAN